MRFASVPRQAWRSVLGRLFLDQKGRPRRTFCRPCLEELENRLAPAVFNVPAGGSLSAAIEMAAEHSDKNNTIALASGTYVAVNQQINVAADKSLTIVGKGSSNTIITANSLDRVFEVVGGTVALRDLTITGGNLLGKLDVPGNPDSDPVIDPVIGRLAMGGGMLIDDGDVTLSDVVVRNNIVQGDFGKPGFVDENGVGQRGGAGQSAYGGGIYLAAGSLTLVHSTLSDNTAFGGFGGDGTGAPDFSTWLGAEHHGGNGGGAFGGGLYVKAGTVIGEQTDFTNNWALGGNGGKGFDGNGGFGGGGGAGMGGGFHIGFNLFEFGLPDISDSRLTLFGSLVDGNHAQGGDGGDGGSGGRRRENPGVGGRGNNGGMAVGGGGFIGQGATVELVEAPYDPSKPPADQPKTFTNDKAIGGDGGAGAPGQQIDYWPVDFVTPRSAFDGGAGGAGGAALGGGVYVAGILNMYGGAIADCRAEAGDGGDGADGAMGRSISDGFASGYGGNGGDGGRAAGGGICVEAGTLNLYQAGVRNDAAIGGHGGKGGDGANGFDGIQGARGYLGRPFGGTHGGTGAQGGHGGNGGDGGDGGDAEGGGCFVRGTLTLVGVTFAEDTVVAGNAGHGGNARHGGNGGRGGDGFQEEIYDIWHYGGTGGDGGFGGNGGDGGVGGHGGNAFGGGLCARGASINLYAGSIAGFASGGWGGDGGDAGNGGDGANGGNAYGFRDYSDPWENGRGGGGGNGGDCLGANRSTSATNHGGDALGAGVYLGNDVFAWIPATTISAGALLAGPAGLLDGIPGIGGATGSNSRYYPGFIGQGVTVGSHDGRVSGFDIENLSIPLAQDPIVPVSLVFSPLPPRVIGGAKFSYPVYVVAVDEFGNVAGEFTSSAGPTYSKAVDLVDDTPFNLGAPTTFNVLGGTPRMPLVNGVAVFTDLSVSSWLSSNRLYATCSALPPTSFPSFSEAFEVIAYTPAQVRQVYGIDKLGTDASGRPLDGTGQTIAIVVPGHNPNLFVDVDAFDKQLGLTSSGPTLYEQYGPAQSFLTVLNQTGQAGSPPPNLTSGGLEKRTTEAVFDVQWAHAIAPGAKIVVIEVNYDITQGARQLVEDYMIGVRTAAGLDNVSVVSMSWGALETRHYLETLVLPKVTADDEARFDNEYLVTPPGHGGVTFLAATGDKQLEQASYPAFSPKVVAVGGTSLWLNPDSSRGGEAPWITHEDGTGGGPSQFEPIPGYQIPLDPTGTKRMTPDVAFFADWNTGGAKYDSFNNPASNPWMTRANGTSLATPCWAGLIAIVNQGRTAAGRAVLNTADSSGPQTLEAIYHFGQTKQSQDFHDITIGSISGTVNGVSVSYSAKVGYDQVTGWGTPKADALVPDLINYGGIRINPTVLPEATNGKHYHQVITATNDISNVTLTSNNIVSGSTRFGLKFTIHNGNPATLTIDGTPNVGTGTAAEGRFHFTLTANDAGGQPITAAYTLVINPTLQIKPDNIPAGTVGAFYSQVISTSGGTGVKKMTYKPPTTGKIHNGLTVTAVDGNPGTVTISGTPTVSGIVVFNVSARDAAGAVTPAEPYILQINAPVKLGGLSKPYWTQNHPGYAATIQVSGGTKPYATQASGLPAGLSPSVNPTTGVISIKGTPAQAGTHNFTITVTDKAGASTTRGYTILVYPSVTFSSLSRPEWTKGRPRYIGVINAHGGVHPYDRKSLRVTGLPAGLYVASFDPYTGHLVIKGTPTIAGVYQVRVGLRDNIGAGGAATFKLTINQPVSLGNLSRGAWTKDHPGYAGVIRVNGGTEPYVLGGGFPANLSGSFDPATRLITISGTPTMVQTAVVTMVVKDKAGSSLSRTYSIRINPAITLSALSSTVWTQDHAGYAATIQVKGGTGPYVVGSLEVTGLPAGLSVKSFNSATGVITIAGTPTQAVAASVDVSVKDQVGASGTRSYGLTINPPLSLSPTSVSEGIKGDEYSQTISADGGTGVKVMQATVVAGRLPAGLSIASSNGDTGTVTIAGTPTAPGAAVVQVTATDGVGAKIRRNYVVTIEAGGGLVDAPKVTSISPAAGVTSGSTVVTITGTNLIGAVAVFFGDQLARIKSATNTTWVVVSPPGTVGTVDVRLVTGIGSAAAGQFQYVQPPKFSPAALPAGAVGVAYNKTISTSGGTDTWVLSYVVVGPVPKGLKISQSSPGGPITISGKPAAAGSFKIKVTAKNALGVSVSQSYLATIN